MALYLGNQKICPAIADNRPWWGIAKNPEFLYEANYECTLADTNYPSKTPSSSQQSVTFPTTTYTTSANANVTFDRYGMNYHNGEALDFKNYEYYVLADYLIDVAYDVDEATMGKAHAVKYTQTGIMPVYRNYTISNGNINYGKNSTALSTSYYSIYRLWYRTAANVLTSVATTYGFYLTPAAIALSATNMNNPVPYINFRTPTLYFRSYSTYHDLASFDNVDAANTIFKTRQRLYRAEKTDNYYETLVDRQAHIFSDNDFPTELI